MSRTTILAAALASLLPLAALTAPAASAGPASAAASASQQRLAPAYKVTAKVNKTTVIAKEDVVVVRGRVTPKAVGQLVQLQQRVEGKTRWKNTGKARIKRAGTYVLKDKPSTGGTREYRVVKPATHGLRKGTSKTMEVAVYAWEKLGYLSQGDTSEVEVDSATVATEYYYPSLVGSTPGTAGHTEYTLGRKCLALEATYALTDASASGATGSVTVTTDGTVRLAQNLVVGPGLSDHVIDLTEVYRLRFDMTSSATPAAYPAVALPKVLCR